MSLQFYKAMPASQLILFKKICRSSELEYFGLCPLRRFGPLLCQNKIVGANFWNIVRMHNSTDYAIFLEKSLDPFFRKVAKNHFWAIFYGFWPK